MQYYDLETANARLGIVKPMLLALRQDRDQVAREQQELQRLEALPGAA